MTSDIRIYTIELSHVTWHMYWENSWGPLLHPPPMGGDGNCVYCCLWGMQLRAAQASSGMLIRELISAVIILHHILCYCYTIYNVRVNVITRLSLWQCQLKWSSSNWFCYVHCKVWNNTYSLSEWTHVYVCTRSACAGTLARLVVEEEKTGNPDLIHHTQTIHTT